MPFTPFHFGPALLAKSLAPKWFSWTAFVASQIVIDLESLYYLSRHEYPVHRVLHTLVGATVAGLATALLVLGGCRLLRGAMPAFARYPHLRSEGAPRAIFVGAIAGGVSHPLLDGLMHADVRPLAPWTAANPWLELVSLDVLHYGCLLCGVLGALLLALRGRIARLSP